MEQSAAANQNSGASHDNIMAEIAAIKQQIASIKQKRDIKGPTPLPVRYFTFLLLTPFFRSVQTRVPKENFHHLPFDKSKFSDFFIQKNCNFQDFGCGKYSIFFFEKNISNNNNEIQNGIYHAHKPSKKVKNCILARIFLLSIIGHNLPLSLDSAIKS